MDTLSGKSAMVIGGSRGIGAAIVERLAANGARVTFTFVRAEARAADTAARTGAQALKVDSADRSALVGSVREAGPLDILVANAGIAVSATRSPRIRTQWTRCSTSTSEHPGTLSRRLPAPCRTVGG